MKSSTFLAVGICWSGFVWAQGPKCKVPAGEVLKIGCTVDCSGHYADAVRKAAVRLGYQVEISEIKKPEDGNYKLLLENYDGVLSPGGHDIHPQYYTRGLSEAKATEKELKHKLFEQHQAWANGRVTAPEGEKNDPKHADKPENLERDEHEYQLMSNYLRLPNKRLPLLGICYGMQMLGVANGGVLVVDIEKDPAIGLPARRTTDVISFTGSRGPLNRYLGQSFTARENHHQALDLNFIKANKKKFKNMDVLATSNEGKIAEIIILKDRPAVGIQSHPENPGTVDESVRFGVFSWLLERACENHGARPASVRPPDSSDGNIVR